MKRLFQNKKLVYITILNFIFMMIVLIYFMPRYETNDDYVMGLISSGAYGDRFKFGVVFSNIIYGGLASLLGTICGCLNWYVVLQYLLILISVVAIMYVIAQYMPIHISLLVNIGCWYLFFYGLVQSVQFTRTAGISLIAGCILIWYYFINRSKASLILGALLCMFGSFVRKDCIPVCVSFFCAIAVASFCMKRIPKKELIRGLSVVVGLISIIGVFLIIDNVYYAMSSEWKGYQEYNEVRADLLDYGIPPYDMYASKYEEIGFSRNDIAIYKGWCLADFEKYDVETLKEIASWKENTKVDFSKIKLWFKDFWSKNYTNIALWIWLCLVLVALNLNKVCKLYGIFNVLLVIMEYGYLYYIGRLVPRVEGVIWMSAVFSMLICIISFYPIKKEVNKKIVKVALIFTVMFIIGRYIYHRGVQNLVENTVQADVLERLSKDKENIYMINTPSFGTVCLCYKPYISVPDYYMDNFYMLGGWDINAPFNRQKLKELNLENPMKEMLYEDNIYYVKRANDSIEGELLYFIENYDKNAAVKKVEDYNGYSTYKFYIKK